MIEREIYAVKIELSDGLSNSSSIGMLEDKTMRQARKVVCSPSVTDTSLHYNNIAGIKFHEAFANVKPAARLQNNKHIFVSVIHMVFLLGCAWIRSKQCDFVFYDLPGYWQCFSKLHYCSHKISSIIHEITQPFCVTSNGESLPRLDNTSCLLGCVLYLPTVPELTGNLPAMFS